MSRREEVDLAIDKNEEKLTDPDGGYYDIDAPMDVFDAIEANRELAEALADEVDERDAVITKLLAMLEPGVSPPKSHTSCDCVECRCHKINEERYARACEIAGRKE